MKNNIKATDIQYFNKTYIKSVLLILLFLAIILYLFITAQRGSDFACYLGAASRLINLENIYKPPFVLNLPYLYSPLFALLLVPFISLPFHIPEFLWLVLSCFLLRRIWILCFFYFEDAVEIKYKKLWIVFSFLAVSRFVIANIGLIQVTIFILWAILESLRLFDKKKIISGALLFALVLNIKILPIAIIPYLLYRNKIREVLFILFFSLLYLFIPALFVGLKFNNFLLGEWWKIINPLVEKRLIEPANGTYGLVAAVPIFIMDTVGKLEIKRNFINLDYSYVLWIVNGLRFFFIVATLAFLRTRPFKKENNRLKEFWEISYVLAVTPLLFPHQHKYAFLLLLPMIIYLYFSLFTFNTTNKRFYVLAVPLFVISVFFTPLIGRDVLGNYLFDLTESFRIITFLAIVLIMLHFYTKPWQLAKK